MVGMYGSPAMTQKCPKRPFSKVDAVTPPLEIHAGAIIHQLAFSRIFLAPSANSRVLAVSDTAVGEGLTLAMMVVRELPPRLS